MRATPGSPSCAVGASRSPERDLQSVLPPTSHTGPWVSTLSVSERTRRTRVVPVMPSWSRRSKQRRAIDREAPKPERPEQRNVKASREPLTAGIERCAQERRSIEERARLDLELAEEVGPVGRKRRERGVPALCHEGRRRTRLGGRSGCGRRGRLHLRLLEMAPDSVAVEAVEEALRRLGPLSAAGAQHVKDERRADLAGVDRAENLRRPR